jgi:RHS repeat-associated protein
MVSVTSGGSGAQSFTVTNFGNTATNYALTVACSGNLTCGSGVPASVTVAAGASTAVGVSYTAGTGLGSGRILLRASPAGSAPADSGWLNVGVVVGGQANPVVEVGAVNPNGTLDRGGCFTAAGAPGVMYECGAFVTGHALPSLRTFGNDRAPALVYNSETAHPVLLISADVGLPNYAVKPDSVSAALTFNNYRQPLSIGIGTLTPGAVRRAAFSYDPGTSIATGLYGYTLEVSFWYGTTAHSTTAAGKVAIVNNAGSPFGVGWSLAGLSYVVSSGGDLLWVDGDGSTTVFHSTGVTGHWIGDALGQPDSLYTNGQGFIERDLKGGGKILLDANWREVAAVNRVGIGTTFEYDGSGRLAHIRTAHVLASGGLDPHLSYDFAYNTVYSSGAFLSAVQAPGLTPGTTRNVAFVVDTARNLTSITDPDSSVEQFEYNGPLAHMMSIVTDSRGSKTALGYTNPARTAWSVTRYGGGSVRNAQDVQVTYVDPRAWPLNYGLLDPAAWPGVYDGPKPVTDTADIVRVWLDRLGQPTKIRDPRFNETYLTRGDPRFPALVTQVDAPGAGGAPGGSVQGVGPRRVSLAYFNARGGLDSAVVKNPLGDGRDAVSRYAYEDALWPDFVTRATSPTGLVSLTGYDPAGNRSWQQVGTDTTRRTTFLYNAWGEVSGFRSARAAAAGEAMELMEYDTDRGNLQAVVSPLGVRTVYLKDGLGRDTLVFVPLDSVRDAYGAATGALLYQVQKNRYDIADRVRASVSIGPRMDFPVPAYSTATPWASVPAESVVVNNVYDAKHDLVAVSRTTWPDSAGVGTITTGYRYDALGRKVVEIPAMADSTRRDSTVYDAAGNVYQSITRRGKTITFTYDVLNRLTHRSVPADAAGTETRTDAPGPTWYFPFFVDSAGGTLNTTNHGSGTLAIPGEEASFSYDGAGNLTRAVNADAVVSRRYYPNGLLKTDTLKVRTYLGTDTTSHVYGLAYTYDLEGRRTQMDLPVNIVPYPGYAYGQTYHYDPTTGALDAIGHTDPAGGSFGYTYDTEGRLTTFSRNDFTEQHYYDADGRDTLRTEVKGSTGWQMHRDRTRYDLRGKQIRIATPSDSTINGYSGLGTLARSYHDAYSNSTPDQNESYTQDALGNQVTERQSSINGNQFQFDAATPITTRRYVPGTARLRGSSIGTSDSYLAGRDTTIYDDGGNRTWFFDSHGVSTPYPDSAYGIAGCSSGCETQSTSPATYVEWMRSWYGADDKLRFVDRRTCYVFQPDGHTPACNPNKEPMPNERPAFEEYRYDALGRRVLVRSRQHYACTTRCQSVVRRIVWDGDQVLAEIQAPGYTYTSATVMEQDVGFKVAAASAVVPDTSDVPPTTSTYYDGYYFGRVLYTHGPGIDHPLSIVRLEYSDSLPGPITIYPHENWNGAFDLGSYDSGSLNPPCKLLHSSGLTTPFQVFTPEPGGGGETKSIPTDTTSHCLKVDWPAPHLWLTNRIRENNMVGAESWNGSLIDGMRDATGQMYMRNRYYDPASGRFTQQDPIGLGGGLNTYGFGNGDPISYSDPFGLKVCFTGPKARQLAAVAMAATHTKFTLDKKNCAANIRATDARPSRMARGYIDLANRPENVSFAYGTGSQGGSGSGDEGILFIDKRDIGKQYGTQWESYGVCSGPPNAIYSQEAIIAHESGHGWAYYFHNNSKRDAVIWENEVHSREGRPQRSQSCHVK